MNVSNDMRHVYLAAMTICVCHAASIHNKLTYASMVHNTMLCPFQDGLDRRALPPDGAPAVQEDLAVD